VCCNTLQKTAIHCKALQNAAKHKTYPSPLYTGVACTDWFSVFAQAMSTMLEALQRNLEEECEGRKAEAAARTSAQDRCSAADERVTKLEWESNQATASLQHKVCSFSSALPLWLQMPLWPCPALLLHTCSAHARTRQARPGT